MRTWVVRSLVAAALAVGVLVGGDALREATITRHEPVPPDSALAVELTASTREGAQEDEAGLTLALVSLCRLEVAATVAPGTFQGLGDHRYRFVLVPDLDEADARQFHGCLQDLRIDHFLAHVEAMESVDAPR